MFRKGLCRCAASAHSQRKGAKTEGDVQLDGGASKGLASLSPKITSQSRKLSFEDRGRSIRKWLGGDRLKIKLYYNCPRDTSAMFSLHKTNWGGRGEGEGVDRETRNEESVQRGELSHLDTMERTLQSLWNSPFPPYSHASLKASNFTASHHHHATSQKTACVNSPTVPRNPERGTSPVLIQQLNRREQLKATESVENRSWSKGVNLSKTKNRNRQRQNVCYNSPKDTSSKFFLHSSYESTAQQTAPQCAKVWSPIAIHWSGVSLSSALTGESSNFKNLTMQKQNAQLNWELRRTSKNNTVVNTGQELQNNQWSVQGIANAKRFYINGNNTNLSMIFKNFLTVQFTLAIFNNEWCYKLT